MAVRSSEAGAATVARRAEGWAVYIAPSLGTPPRTMPGRALLSLFGLEGNRGSQSRHTPPHRPYHNTNSVADLAEVAGAAVLVERQAGILAVGGASVGLEAGLVGAREARSAEAGAAGGVGGGDGCGGDGGGGGGLRSAHISREG